MEQNLQSAGERQPYGGAWQQAAPDLVPYEDWGEGGNTTPQPSPQPPAVLPACRPPAEQPGAIQNPCCMGSAALDLMDALRGFIEEELADRRALQALSRRAPAWARGPLRELGESAGDHARRLMSACYLIDGRCYRPAGVYGPVYLGNWCQALRERYHTEACGGLNYARAAESTTDTCLRKLLQELSREEYHHAEVLMGLLQRSL